VQTANTPVTISNFSTFLNIGLDPAISLQYGDMDVR